MDLIRMKYLLARYAAQECTAEERQELDASLLGSPEAHELFWQESTFSGLLHEVCRHEMGKEIVGVAMSSEGSGAGGRSRQERSDKRPSVGPKKATLFNFGGWESMRMPVVVVLLVSAMALSTSTTAWLMNRKDGEVQLVVSAASQGERSQDLVRVTPVAYLTANTACAWGNGSSKLQMVGNSIEAGEEIVLQEGIAEFRLANGVYISVEGPAALVPTSPDSLVLQYGKVTTQVPWPVSEFRILAGSCRLTATDAEFGVSVSGGRIDTHVFSGEVLAVNAALYSDGSEEKESDQVTPTEPTTAFTKAVVHQGRALAISSQRNVLKISRWAKAARSLFATKLTMAGPLPISHAYCDAILASQPFGYWRFESVENGAVVSEVPGVTDLLIEGDLRLSGFSGNRVAEFRPSSDGHLISRDRMDEFSNTDYSIEVWAKPSHVHAGDILALCATEKEWNVLLIELQGIGTSLPRSSGSRTHPTSLRFTHRNPPSGSFRTGTHCFSKEPYSVRRWQHIVAVKRGEQMELYVDAKVTARGSDKSFLAPQLRLVVGRQDPNESILPFSGQLDELAVYRRALSQEEIQTHFQLIDWTRINSPATEREDI